MSFNHLKNQIQRFILWLKEILRQAETIDLIPSESLAPFEVLELLGSPLTNKYSEGYPGKRYYPGNIYYDEIEELAQKSFRGLWPKRIFFCCECPALFRFAS